LHVTIDDIEEAASVGLNESTANHSDIPEKEESKVIVEDERNKNKVSAMLEAAQNEIEDIVEKHNVRVVPKQ
jgi:septum formation topological specificity factor MinE